MFEPTKTADSTKKSRFCSHLCSDRWWNVRRQTDHPIYPRIDIDNPEFETVRLEREYRIHIEKTDPFRYGQQPAHWHRADEVWNDCTEMLCSGGNRAGKTLWAARKVIEVLLRKDECHVMCCHTSNQTSVTVQQPAVYNYLPVELRATKKGKIHYLNYSLKNGFTDGSFILPNKSRCDFLNYTQSEQVIEGRDADLIWRDELVPAPWPETLRFRLISRQGKMIITQTPIEGVASAYKEFVGGGKIIEWDDAPLLGDRSGMPGWPRGKAPRKMDCVNPCRKVFWMFTKDNPFSPNDAMEDKLVGLPLNSILTRAYGWATDNIGKAFPRFRPDIHVVTKDQVPEGGTLYMITDPAGSRNWFTLWVKVMANGHYFVVKEWPDVFRYGEWSLPSNKPDGKEGEAQRNEGGRGYPAYRQLFRGAEEELGAGEPMLRLIDPKAGGSPVLDRNGGISMIDKMLESEDATDDGMLFIPAPGVQIDQRHAAINSLLSWDSERPMDSFNQPRLYIHEDCQSLIWSLSEHTGRDGQKGANKDPIDCLGMLVTSDCPHVESGSMVGTGGGAY